jgi:D-lyxose ketol-isomerase
MKRSEINNHMKEAKVFFDKMNIKLPAWAAWSPGQWKGKYSVCSEIAENMMGWDLTDFGSGHFSKRGLILFTVRNGNIKKDKKSYCEKIMIAGEHQETPMHFHWKKMEDIINRGGGNLVMELYHSGNDGKFSDTAFKIKIDGVIQDMKPGAKVTITPGESICLEQGIYHRFWGENGKVIVGEVSTVNDDATDNRFYEEIGRFPEIVEDEEPLYLLVSDYKKYF